MSRHSASIRSRVRGSRAAWRRRSQVEQLEGRLLLAADVLPDWEVAGFLSDAPEGAAAFGNAASVAEQQAEGEPAPDLVAFAKALADAGAVYFGADWCPFCTQQKERFGDGKSYLPFVEVTNPDRSLNEIGIAEEIQSFPTWKFADDTVLVGLQSLDALAAAAGIDIPQGSAPSFVPIELGAGNALTVKAGSPLHLPIDAYDPNSNQLTISVSVNNPAGNPDLLTAEVLQNNRSMSIDAGQYGEMVFQLFEQRAPDAAGRVIQLAESGFYDGLTFHRVAPNFVIQGGDPTGSGGGGSTLGDFDDDYHPDLQHNQSGVLSFAKTDDDTNDSQFFITDRATRFLDFNHSIFGQLVEGDDARAALQRVPTTTSRVTGNATTTGFDTQLRDQSANYYRNFVLTFSNGSLAGTVAVVDSYDPTTGRITLTEPLPFAPTANSSFQMIRRLTMEDVSIFTDTENGVVMLKAAHGETGTAQVTVTVTDGEGLTATQTFTVNVVADDINTPPFLTTTEGIQTGRNEPVTVQLDAFDVEDDDLVFDLELVTNNGATIETINAATGEFRITPPAGFVGTFQVEASVRGLLPDAGINNDAGTDHQRLTVTVSDNGPASLDLLPASDSGISDTDNLTNLDSLQILVSGVARGATVLIRENGVTLASGEATADTITLSVDVSALADGARSFTAVQQINGQTSGATAPLVITLDRQAPQFTSTPNSNGAIDTLYTYNAETDEDANSPVFSLENEPAGAQADPATGVVTWTPAQNQIGVATFQILAADAAGNVGSQDIVVDVESDGLVSILLRAVDDQGDPLSRVLVGESFFVEMVVRDLRDTALGVAAAYADMLFDSDIVEVNGVVAYDANFSTGRSGTVGDGLIDELGATAVGGLGDGEFLVLTVPFTALAVGPANIRLAAAATEVELVGDGVVSVEDVDYGELDFEVTPPFRAVDDDFSFDEDAGEQGLTVLANDTKNPGVGDLVIVGVDVSAAGVTPVITAQGTLIGYTPPPNFNGEDTFTYRISDGGDDVSEATVTLNVQSVNDPPQAVDDEFTGNRRVAEDSVSNFLDVLANDEIAPDVNETLRIVRVGATDNSGTVTIGSAGQHLNYTPLANFSGLETFTYTIRDNNGGEATATVTVEVEGANDPPNAVADNFTVPEDSSDNEFDVLANDTTENGETLRITAISALESGMIATISSDGTRILFSPRANFSGPTSFVYTIDDGRGGTDTARVSVTVTPSNDPPTANDDDGLRFGKNTGPHAIDVLANDSLNGDQGETLTITAVTQGSNGGVVAIAGDSRTVNYTPANDFVGEETFTYTVSDGVSTDVATVTITVLDFVPARVSGTVFIDLDEDGVRDPSESPVSGVVLRITGTDENGVAVDRIVHSGPDGGYAFEDLVPGQYQVTQTQPSMLRDGSLSAGDESLVTILNSNSFTVQLADGDEAADNDFAEGGRLERYYGIRDLFRSTRRDTGFTMIDSATTEPVSWLEGEWQAGATIQVTASGGAASYEVRMGEAMLDSAGFPLNPPPASQVVDVSPGEDHDVMLLRITAPMLPSQMFRQDTPPPAGQAVVQTQRSSSQDSAAEGEFEPGEGEADAARFAAQADAVYAQWAGGGGLDGEDDEDDRLPLFSEPLN